MRSEREVINSKHRFLGSIATCLLLGAATFWPVSAAGAGDGVVRGFSSVANATAVRVTYTVPGFLVINTVADGAAPIAQATLDSAGLARSFASAVYPGDTVVTLPGTFAAFSGQSVPVAYPLYVVADYPVTPEAKASDPSGNFAMVAMASDVAVKGDAAAGRENQGPVARSVASIERAPDGTVTAVATAIVESLSFGDGGLLKVARVRSSSTSVLRPGDEKPETQSDLSIEGASVGGQRVSIGPNGIEVLGHQSPGATDQLTQQLNAVLGQAGISIRVLNGQALDGTGAADVLSVQSVQTLPVPGNPQGTIAYQFGGAMASVTAGAASPGAVGIGAGSGMTSISDIADGTDRLNMAPGGIAVGSPTASVGPFSPEDHPARRVLLARDFRDDVRLFYWVIICGVVLLVTGSTILRRQGVRSKWIS